MKTRSFALAASMVLVGLALPSVMAQDSPLGYSADPADEDDWSDVQPEDVLLLQTLDLDVDMERLHHFSKWRDKLSRKIDRLQPEPVHAPASHRRTRSHRRAHHPRRAFRWHHRQRRALARAKIISTLDLKAEEASVIVPRLEAVLRAKHRVAHIRRTARATLRETTITPEQAPAALRQFRSAPSQAQAELDAACRKLREVLTLKQELQLVGRDVLP